MVFPSPPRSTLFPYTTLFRSAQNRKCLRADKFMPMSSISRSCVISSLSAVMIPTARTIPSTSNVAGNQRLHRRLSQRSEEHTSELQSQFQLVCRLPHEKNNHR